MRKLLAGAKSLSLIVATTALMLVLATTAVAVRGDRNNDGIPDRWAKKHGLNAKKDQTNRDQDHDKVKNICEFEAGTNPKKKNSDRDRVRDGREDSDEDGMVNSVESTVQTDCGESDTDGDGTEDGDEISGFIHSFDGEILQLRMVDGAILSAPITEYTYVYCEEDVFAKPSEEEDDTSSSEEDDSSSSSFSAFQGDGGGHQGGNCGVEALTPGRVVKAFYVEDGYFVKLKLLD